MFSTIALIALIAPCQIEVDNSRIPMKGTLSFSDVHDIIPPLARMMSESGFSIEFQATIMNKRFQGITVTKCKAFKPSESWLKQLLQHIKVDHSDTFATQNYVYIFGGHDKVKLFKSSASASNRAPNHSINTAHFVGSDQTACGCSAGYVGR